MASTVIDVGAGVGAVHLALLEAGARRAVDVDASREYIGAARAEAVRRGLADRVEYLYGDLVELGADLPPADVVAMDSVLCCYPFLDRLLAAALNPRPRLLGITYPRDVWWMVVYMRLHNSIHAVRRSPSRYFIYRHPHLRSLLDQHGYREIHDGGSAPWRVVVYRRIEGEGGVQRGQSEVQNMAGEARSLGGVNVIGGILALDTIALITLATQTTSGSAYIAWASLLFALAVPTLTAAYLMESNEENFGYATSWFRSAARLKEGARQRRWDRIWPITLATVWAGFILSAAGVLLLALDLLESHQPVGVSGWLILGVAIVGTFLLWRWHRSALKRLGVVTATDLEDTPDA